MERQQAHVIHSAGGASGHRQHVDGVEAMKAFLYRRTGARTEQVVQPARQHIAGRSFSLNGRRVLRRRHD